MTSIPSWRTASSQRKTKCDSRSVVVACVFLIQFALLARMSWSRRFLQPQSMADPLGLSTDLAFSSMNEESERWEGLLKGLHSYESRDGCSVDWYINHAGVALAGFRHLAQIMLKQDHEPKSPDTLISRGIQTIVLTVTSSVERHRAVSDALRKAGVKDWLWQTGGDIDALDQNLNWTRQMFAAHMNDERARDREMSLASKHMLTIQDFSSNLLHVNNASRYASSQKSPSQYLSYKALQRHKSLAKPQYLLLVEDDSLFVPNFRDALDDVIKSLPSDWYYVSLAACCGFHQNIDKVQLDTPLRIGSYSFSEDVRQGAPQIGGNPFARCSGAGLFNLAKADRFLAETKRNAESQSDVDPIDMHLGKLLRNSMGRNEPLGSLHWAEPPIVYQRSKAVWDSQGKIFSSIRVGTDV